MRKQLLIILCVLPLSLLGQGQVGSPYTRFGMGDLFNKSFARERAMGGTSLAFSGNGTINMVNPASFADMDSMTFIFDIGLEGGMRLYETTGLSSSDQDVQLSHLAFAFPVTRWWGASFGLMPYSTRSYSIVSFNNDFNVDKNYIFYGSGGINQVYFGNGFQPFTNLRLGVNLYYYFGKMNRENALIFDDDSGSYININENNTIQINDFGFDLGLQYELPVTSKSSILFGATFALDNKLNSRRSSIVTNSLSTGGSAIIDTVYSSDMERGEIHIPLSFGAGLGYQFSDQFTLGVDYMMQNWSEATFFNAIDSLGNSNRLSAGMEYIPAGSTGASLKYWQKVRYRVGGHYEQTYLNFPDRNGQITDFGISFGFGLPMKRSKSIFNLSLELGQRGTTENDLIRERYLILGVNFSLSDIWFVKRKFD